MYLLSFFFFFQAEDGIRDLTVTGVQTCALPISVVGVRRSQTQRQSARPRVAAGRVVRAGRASHKGGYHRQDPAGAAHRLLLAPGRPPTVLRYAWRSPTS